MAFSAALAIAYSEQSWPVTSFDKEYFNLHGLFTAYGHLAKDTHRMQCRVCLPTVAARQGARQYTVFVVVYDQSTAYGHLAKTPPVLCYRVRPPAVAAWHYAGQYLLFNNIIDEIDRNSFSDFNYWC